MRPNMFIIWVRMNVGGHLPGIGSGRSPPRRRRSPLGDFAWITCASPNQIYGKSRGRGIFWTTSPFRDRVAKLRGPSEGLGGNAANVWSTQLQAVQQWNAMSKGGEVDRWKYVAILICRQCWLFLTHCLAICGYNCCKVRAIWGNLE